jgi:hypothetical protein
LVMRRPRSSMNMVFRLLTKRKSSSTAHKLMFSIPADIRTICKTTLTMYQSQPEHLPSTYQNRSIWL